MRKFYLFRLCAAFMLATMPLHLASCSSGGDESTNVGTGMTASEFAGGASSIRVHGTTVFTISPQGGNTSVSTDATQVVGVEGFLIVSDLSVPVFLTYTTSGDPETTGILNAKVEVTLAGTEYSDNASLLSTLGAPSDSTFVKCTVDVNYLAEKVTVETRVSQPGSFDPDVPGDLDLETGVSIYSSSFMRDLNFYLVD